MLSRRFESGQEALLKVRDWSGGPHGSPGVVGRPSRRSGSGREALPEFRVWLGCPPKGTGSSPG